VQREFKKKGETWNLDLVHSDQNPEAVWKIASQWVIRQRILEWENIWSSAPEAQQNLIDNITVIEWDQSPQQLVTSYDTALADKIAAGLRARENRAVIPPLSALPHQFTPDPRETPLRTRSTSRSLSMTIPPPELPTFQTPGSSTGSEAHEPSSIERVIADLVEKQKNCSSVIADLEKKQRKCDSVIADYVKSAKRVNDLVLFIP
jgi:hypothetical protein